MDAPRDHANETAPEAIDLKVIDNASGAAYTFTARIGERQALPEGRGEFTIRSYQAHLTFGGQDIGAGIEVELKREGQETQTILLPLHFPSFDKMRGGALFFSITGQKTKDFPPQSAAERYYTGLQVTKDPGVPIVYAGFIIMLIGFVITFFMSHQMIAVEITSQAKGSRVTVSGVSNRNKLGMDRKIARLAVQLQRT
jgi:cytochrome c biogenesis protein